MLKTCKGICVYNLAYNFFIQLFPFKTYVFVAYFSNAIQHVKESFSKGTFQIEIVSLHEIFHMTYSYYRGVNVSERVPGGGSQVKCPRLWVLGPGSYVQVLGPESRVLGPTCRVCATSLYFMKLSSFVIQLTLSTVISKSPQSYIPF